MIGYWKLDETSSPALDSSGFNNTGVWQNSPTSVTDVAGTFRFDNERSLDFDGTSSYVSVPATESLKQVYDTDRVSVSVWSKNDAAPGCL